jgi:hypothetical protein
MAWARSRDSVFCGPLTWMTVSLARLMFRDSTRSSMFILRSLTASGVVVDFPALATCLGLNCAGTIGYVGWERQPAISHDRPWLGG